MEFPPKVSHAMLYSEDIGKGEYPWLSLSDISSLCFTTKGHDNDLQVSQVKACGDLSRAHHIKSNLWGKK